MQITSLIVQNSVAQKDMGVASSSRAFFQQIGGSVGVSLFGVIFINKLNSVMAPAAHGHSFGAESLDPQSFAHMPSVERALAFVGISHGLDAVFWWAVPIAAAVFLLALFVKEIPLRGRVEPATDSGKPAPELVR
jgi:hypothetical protein